MAFKLGPGERIVFEGHPSWRSILDFYVKGVLAIGVIAAVVVFWGNTIGDEVSEGVVALVLFGGAAVIALVGFVKRVATRYTITNRRLHIKHGVISREVQETRLERVQDVNYSQSMLQRLLRIGDVDFDTAAHDPTDFVFAGVADPGKVVQEVHEATAGSAGIGDDDRG